MPCNFTEIKGFNTLSMIISQLRETFPSAVIIDQRRVNVWPYWPWSFHLMENPLAIQSVAVVLLLADLMDLNINDILLSVVCGQTQGFACNIILM